ncbi:MAG: CRTAC1 family protein [Pseudomonadota bacterium]
MTSSLYCAPMRIIALLIYTLTTSSAAAALFDDVAASAGVDFRHFNGMAGDTHFPEMMGAGVAVFDYDGDGDLDLYFSQGVMLGPERTLTDAVYPPAHPVPLTDRLYRNDIERGEPGSLRFTDVTAAAGLGSTSHYGMGVSVGDIDNDGHPDLYLSNFGSNRLLRNRGDGSFEDITEKAGVDDPRWSVIAVFFDYDKDGFLDLYVVNYVNFSFATAKTCRSSYDAPDYCSPQSYEPMSDRMFRNRGDGTFVDVTDRLGIAAAEGPGLGAVAGDFDGDGWTDLYVANDGAANFLWLNQRGERFRDDALLAGVAVNMAGSPEASMGVDAADFDGDGDLDLFMTHLDRQTNTLYENDGQGWFTDRTSMSVLGKTSFPYTGFGTLWFDYDNDGWLDLMSANGAVVKIEAQDRSGDPLPLRQANQLWRNTGGGRYEDVSEAAGRAFAAPTVSRGAAFGDLDNDGDTDIVVTNNAGAPQVLLNRAGEKQGWIGVRVRSAADGPDILGATVEADLDDRHLVRRVRTDGSYVSANDPRVIIGLGAQGRESVTLTVKVPGGGERRFEGLAPGRYHELTLEAQP